VADLYLDECVRSDAVALLEGSGHTVAHARRVLPGAADDEQVLLASRTGAVLVTSNLADFRLLHGAWHRWARAWGVAPAPQHPGILVTRNAWPAARLAAEVDAFFRPPSGAPARPLPNRLYRWVDGDWREEPPLPEGLVAP
jgi:hypothetical protein